MTIAAADLATFTLNPAVEVSREAIEAHGIVVDQLDWRASSYGSVHGEYALRRLLEAGVANPADYVEVASRTVDHSGFCSFEGKMEYHYEVTLVVLPKAIVAAHKTDFAWEDAAADAGFAEYAA